MDNSNWIIEQAQKSLQRLLPRIEPLLADVEVEERDVFVARLHANFPTVFRLLYSLYGTHYDFFYHLEQILTSATQMYVARPSDLKALDRQRESDQQWFQSETMMGGVCYVDLFADNLDGIRTRIPYFKELGLTYLHLMPLFRSPETNSDGGYAVSSYREVNPALGMMSELSELAANLRQNGISLVLDFVFNHTSDEHEWALNALAGDEDYQAFYHMFQDRTLPDLYEHHLREIFPEQAPGNFTYRPEISKWVWTTFNNFQWDLNYNNPAVFNAMLQEMLFLANQGIEVLRLDAVAFIWKQLGTPCEGRPQVHWLIQAFSALNRIVAPAMLFKSEAIVHPAEVASYISWEECPISYNPTLMALLWESLATRDVKLLRKSMINRFALPEPCTWVNYVRCHDDIGWTFADEDAAAIGINGFDHRQFLNAFYIGSFPGSFSTGLPFNYNPVTRDMRICGMAASLAGLEQAIVLGNEQYQEHAIRRLLLIHSVILSAGGIPLIYLGDELGTLNDYNYRGDSSKTADNRWTHRPRFDWERAASRNDVATHVGQIFEALTKLIHTRKATPALANGQARFFDTGNSSVLGYVRNRQVLVLGNFSEFEQTVDCTLILPHWSQSENAVDLVTGQAYATKQIITLQPYQFVWLAEK